MHWSAQYVGLPYKQRGFDCADLARRVLQEVFGRTVFIPSEYGHGPVGYVEAMRQHKDSVVDRVATPIEGDGVLLVTRGRLQHIGVYCVINGEGWVLHNQDSAGVLLQRVRDLPRYGYTVEGYYRWK